MGSLEDTFRKVILFLENEKFAYLVIGGIASGVLAQPRMTQDFDMENIAIRHKGRLDEKYLISWAQTLSDEAEDMRIYNEIKRLLEL
ncbi:MAG: hypothetical protein AB1595_04145 [bacterium]